MDEPAGRRPPRAPRRGYDIHQTHFFYRDDLAAGATVVDHVTGQSVGRVHEVGRHVFEGHGAAAADGGEPGDLVVEVVELEPVVPVRMPWREPRTSGGVRRGVDPQGEETVTVDVDRDDRRAVEVDPAPAPAWAGIADEPDADAYDEDDEDDDEDDPEPTARFQEPDEDDDDADDADGAGGRRVTGASVAQGVAVLVLAPLLALVVLAVLLVLLVG